MSVARELPEQVRASGLMPRDGALVVMLSGGRDSVCLLDVAVRLCAPGAVRALHVNYGLRPQADAEERHCAQLCERLGGVPLERVRATRPPGAGNLQAWARDVRYREARALAQRCGAAAIAVGHTATDQVETILYRLAASPGRRALLGMSPRDGRLIRPLLSIDREQTAAYCGERGLLWCEDESNLSDRYARGRVRRRLLPALREVHPAAEANVLRTAELLREETELLDELVDRELAGARSIELARLASLPSALARMVVVRLAEQAGGVLIPQAGERVGEILELGRRGGRAQLHVGGSVGAVVEGGRLGMVRLAPRGARPDGPAAEAS